MFYCILSRSPQRFTMSLIFHRVLRFSSTPETRIRVSARVRGHNRVKCVSMCVCVCVCAPMCVCVCVCRARVRVCACECTCVMYVCDV
jgi:hypothetical protein